MPNAKQTFSTAKTWATGHVVAAAAIAAVAGFLLHALLF